MNVPSVMDRQTSFLDNEEPNVEYGLASQVLLVDKYPIAFKGFATVRYGTLFPPSSNEKPRTVAVKTFAVTSNIGDDGGWKFGNIHLEWLREKSRIWHTLRHPNIVSYYGYLMGPEVYTYHAFSLVSEWVGNGNAIQYLAANPAADRWLLCQGVAAGLLYLHSRDPPVVHGNLCMTNVLVNSDGQVRISDSGLSAITECLPMGLNSSYMGAIRYFAPELLGKTFYKTAPADVWAFLCIAFEILFGERPYAQYKTDGGVYSAMARGEHPFKIPSDHPFSTRITLLMRACWDSDPAARPAMLDILASGSLA